MPSPAYSAAAKPTVAQIDTCATQHASTWMGCLIKSDPAFANFPLSHVALPGSHDAASYELDPQSADATAGSACAPTAAAHIPGAMLVRWSTTQDEPLTVQLDKGVRYLDLQVAYNGNGAPVNGWRIANTLFSQRPLFDYLDDVATWAHRHPSEIVIVDVRSVCYDNAPNQVAVDGLWANFATRAASGGATLADVAANAASLGAPVSEASINQLTTSSPGHNVVLLVPGSARDASLLTARFRVSAAFTSAGSNAVPQVLRALVNPGVAPQSSSEMQQAAEMLQSFPLVNQPVLGSLAGHGLYVDQLAFAFSGQPALLTAFGGLIHPFTFAGKRGAIATLQPWEAMLLGSPPSSLNRASIVRAWTHPAIVISDAVEMGGFIPAVLALNATQ